MQPTAPSEETIIQGRYESDEEFARRLANEEARLYQYYQQRQNSTNRTNNNTKSSSSSNRRNVNINNTAAPAVTEMYDIKENASHETTSQESGDIAEIEDEVYARKVEQELHDEEVARQLQEADERRASRHEARRMAAATPAGPRYSFKCACGYILCFTVTAAAAVAMVYYFFIQDNDGPNWIWNPEDFRDEDPFDAKGPDDVSRWRTPGRGLDMEVINALDPEWYEFFYVAIQDWDSGYPDALTLATREADPDYECSRVNGKVKVCNGDYGATSWKGINYIQIDGSGYIFASTAQLNDYYFNGNKGSMQYTMCHELGHAWGLPHTDEIFGNADLGNCMDYTHNEDENKRPDSTNYEFLYQLYGLVPGSQPYNPPTSAPTNEPVDLGNVSSQQIQAGSDNGGRMLLDQMDMDLYEASIVDARTRIMSNEKEGVRLLHRNEAGEVHEADLLYGHKLRIHKLFAHIENNRHI
jgi:hypothetical protein